MKSYLITRKILEDLRHLEYRIGEKFEKSKEDIKFLEIMKELKGSLFSLN